MLMLPEISLRPASITFPIRSQKRSVTARKLGFITLILLVIAVFVLMYLGLGFVRLS
jgi:hypothetical protein